LLGLLIILVALAGFGAVYQGIATMRDLRTFLPPGQLVDVGGYKLHIFCTGERKLGDPTVILDASFPGTVSTWIWVQPGIAQVTRVCAYDRAGLGWSERGPVPRDALQHARELHNLLKNADVPGPYVLVGHSLGGLSVRMFAAQYSDEVASMVLIEGTHPDAWQRLGRPEGVGVDPNQLAVAPFLARLGLFRLGLIPLHATDPNLPSHQQEEMQAFYDSVKYMDTVRDVNTAFPMALEQVRTLGDLGAKPLLVVLGSKGDGSLEPLRELFEQQAALSTNNVTRVVTGATHTGLVHNREHAQATTAAILEVVESVYTGQPLVTP
jgi:pimeloyl-ACP methyl ester carboxylesterase